MHPSKPPSRDLSTKTSYSWKSFSPMHFTWEVEWPKNRHTDHYYSWADQKIAHYTTTSVAPGRLCCKGTEPWRSVVLTLPSSYGRSLAAYHCLKKPFGLCWKEKALCFAELQLIRSRNRRCSGVCKMTAGSCRAGGADSLVEVGLRLFTLNGSGEGIDGFVCTEHGGIPHRVVSLGREAQAVSPQAPSNTARPQVLYPIT